MKKVLKLLIVDDEPPAVEALKKVVNWEKHGISTVFTAFDIFQAKDVFKNNSIDIMICDIEMPQGSGLDLLKWVREHYPKTRSIFLTCHSEFEYAKEALRLGSLDYLLKPVPLEELEKAVMKAVTQIEEDNKTEELKRFGNLWHKHKSRFIEHFWLDVLNHKIPSKPQEIKNTALRRNIPYKDNIKYLPILLSVKRWLDKLCVDDEKLMEFALKNSSEEIFIKEEGNGVVVELGQGTLLALLYIKNNANPDFEQIKKDCESYISICHQHLNCDLSCYIGESVCSHELSEMVKRLAEMDINNVTCCNKVFPSVEHAVLPLKFEIPDMDIWETMISKGLTEKVISGAKTYLSDPSNAERLDASRLHQFQQDFLQMIYTVLKRHGIMAHQLLSEDHTKELYVKGAHSVPDLICWMEHVAEKAACYIKKTEKTQSIIEKVCKFIASNIDKDITCESVAGHVYLNHDYLTRIFKKETGVTLSEYILLERIKIAKELLSKTDLPISSVATQVGYSNLAHFSRIFKKYTKMNPINYRRKNA